MPTIERPEGRTLELRGRFEPVPLHAVLTRRGLGDDARCRAGDRWVRTCRPDAVPPASDPDHRAGGVWRDA